MLLTCLINLKSGCHKTLTKHHWLKLKMNSVSNRLALGTIYVFLSSAQVAKVKTYVGRGLIPAILTISFLSVW